MFRQAHRPARAESSLISKGSLLEWLTSSPDLFIFGSLAKHLVSPSIHPQFHDIDAIAISPAIAVQLQAQFGYVFIKVSRPGQHPRYLLGKSPHYSKTIQLLEMRSEADAHTFLNNAQYDIDRFAISNHQQIFDPAIGAATILQGISDKIARRVNGPRNMHLFAPNRPQIEQRHRLKLLRKGFVVLDQPFP